MSATEGAYVRYPQDEWLAVLTLESRRHDATIVGEDLGTVPPEVRTAMDEHAIQRMYVVQFEANASADPPLGASPEPVVASLNTHDMPPFAAFWEALDVADQLDLGLIDEYGVQPRLEERAALRRAVADHFAMGDGAADADAADQALPALLVHLARSDARALLVNIEDLWLETRPQNVPGTSTERPNWQHRLRFSLEQIIGNRGIRSALEAIGRLRAAPGE
jgi:4-alpha-glucanotransferase